MANEGMNKRLRAGFGKSVEEERKQSGTKPVEEMAVPELVEELAVVGDRLGELQAELAARAEKAEDREERDG